jgi:TPR repeat protein
MIANLRYFGFALAMLVAAAIFRTSPAQAQVDPTGFKDALAAYNAGDIDKARVMFKQLCDAGDANSCHNLGVIISSGTRISEMTEEAVGYFKTACDHPTNPYYMSCANYALARDQYGEAGYNAAEAEKYYILACEKGRHAMSCTKAAAKVRVGAMFISDKAQIEARLQKAREYNQIGCDGSEAGSCIALSNSLIAGQGGAKDFEQGLLAAQKACDLNPQYDDACLRADSRLADVKDLCSAGDQAACRAAQKFSSRSVSRP